MRLPPCIIFQSTLPLRRATWSTCLCHGAGYISIHAPLAESDEFISERGMYWEFQSTLPLRRATLRYHLYITTRIISIHAPLAESDRIARRRSRRRIYDFNPRSPCGERQVGEVLESPAARISIHAPLAGSDADALHVGLGEVISIHAPLAESDLYAKSR